IGSDMVKDLIFTYDVVLLADNLEDLQKHLNILEKFCEHIQMPVNLVKTTFITVGTKKKASFSSLGHLLIVPLARST
ncbi:hypothetical protein R1flu_008594, partial [Riccia fluitans]